MRREYEMTQEQFDRLLEACKPVPMIALQCGTPARPQENANMVWRILGDEMGFVWDTVAPVARGKRFFTAEESPRPQVRPLHIVFDGPPSHESGRFVECETPDGRGVAAGEWVERDDGLWALVVQAVYEVSP